MAWHSLSSSDPQEDLRCTCGVSRVPEELFLFLKKQFIYFLHEG